MSEPRPPLGEGEEVEQLHRTVVREAAEPEDGFEPAPWFLWALVAGALFIGGWYLGRYSGTWFTTDVHQALPEGEVPPEVAEAAAAPADGAAVYAKCATCHQAEGQGVPGSFPPLVGSEWVTGPPEIPVQIVLGGLTGPIDVAGVRYEGVMPAWAGQMSDAEIAAVVTHERRMAGVAQPEVDVALVTELRAKVGARTAPFTAAELKGGTP